jgi:multidrug efflux pump subunit AcrA (membrane-fusion protein)
MPDHMLRYTPPPKLRLIGIIVACVAVLIVVAGLITRVMADRQVSTWTDANALPTVSVINLAASEGNGNLVLPGNVQAINSAPIYARVSGYLKKWYVDIGTPVKAGQLLAEIDVPDQDQQLAQAKADLNTAAANQNLSGQTLQSAGQNECGRPAARR